MMGDSGFNPTYGPTIGHPPPKGRFSTRAKFGVSSDRPYVIEQSEIFSGGTRFKLDSPFVQQSPLDYLFETLEEFNKFNKLSDQEKIIYLYLRQQAEKKQRARSTLEKFLLTLANTVLEGVPNFLSPSLYQRALFKFFSISEDPLYKNKFEIIFLDPMQTSNYLIPSEIASLIWTSGNSVSDIAKNLFYFARKFYYSAGIKEELDNLANLDTKGISINKLSKTLFVTLSFLFFESVLIKYFVKEINNLNFPSVEVERLGEAPYYYFKSIKAPDTIEMTFNESKRGMVLRFLDTWRSRAFRHRDQGVFYSNPAKDYIFRNDLSKVRASAIIIPVAPMSTRLNFKGLEFPDENRLGTFPLFIIHGMYPISISGINFSQEATEAMTYSVTFAIEDIEITSFP